jgi:N-acetylneuraminic acid mutarotase
VFGGYGASHAFDDTYKLDFDDLSWTKVEISGERPGARENHASTDNGNTFYIAGGCNPDKGKCYENTWSFDTTTQHWTLEDKSSITPRGGYDMDVIGGVIYAFGGNFFLDKVYDFLEAFDTGDACPDECSGHGRCTEAG